MSHVERGRGVNTSSKLSWEVAATRACNTTTQILMNPRTTEEENWGCSLHLSVALMLCDVYFRYPTCTVNSVNKYMSLHLTCILNVLVCWPRGSHTIPAHVSCTYCQKVMLRGMAGYLGGWKPVTVRCCTSFCICMCMPIRRHVLCSPLQEIKTTWFTHDAVTPQVTLFEVPEENRTKPQTSLKTKTREWPVDLEVRLW